VAQYNCSQLCLAWNIDVTDQTALSAELATLRAQVTNLQRRLLDQEQLAERAEQQRQRAQLAEARYRTLIENLPLVTYMADIADVNATSYVSPRIETLLGFTPEEWSATPSFWLSRVHPDDAVRVRAAQVRFQATLEPEPIEHRMLAKDGRVVWIHDESVVVRDDAGQPLYLLGFTQDITARKRSENVQHFLAEAGALLAASLDYEATLVQITRLAVPRVADGCSVYVASEDGRVRQVADAHLTPEIEAIARELDRRYPADPQAQDALALVMRTGSTLLVPEVSERDLLEAARDEKHLALMRAQALRGFVAIPLLARGRVLGVITFSSETPTRRLDNEDLALAEELARRAALAIDNARLFQEAQRALRRQEETLSILDALLDNTPIGLGVMDAQLRFVRVNDALAEITGQPAEAHLGRGLRAVAPAFADLAEPLLQQVLDIGQPVLGQELQLDAPLGPGKSRTFLVSYYPIALHDQPVWGVGTAVIEITERKRAEEAALALERRLLETQKLESLGVLAGGIAHDFNNLLVAILGNAELALMDLPPESPARESVVQVQIASRRAAELTGQMLAYSGRGRFVVEPIDMNSLIAELTTLLHASIGRRVRLQTALAQRLPIVEADATQIRQVVLNLVVNAAEAIGDADGVVMVATGLRHVDAAFLATAYLALDLPPGDYVALEVSDTGCGMDQATIDRIFEPFFTTKFTGRGLGMAAVLGIVRGHRGALKIDSTPGRGTTVTVLLPPLHAPAASGQALAAIGRGANRAPADRMPGASQPQGTVLIVDDDPSVLAVTGRMLERRGYATLKAEGGRAGLEAFRAHAPQITAVLLDLTMPQMSGEEVYRELRQIDAGVRVIVMSGYTAEEMRGHFPPGAAIGFLQKPFAPESLDDLMRKAELLK
jgi:PAS domain S-box-containing protein